MGCTGSKHTAPPEPLKALHTAPSVSLEESQTAPSVSLEASQTAPTVPPGALRFEVAATLESTLADWRAVGLDPEIEPLDSVLNAEDGLFCLSKGGEFASKLRNIVAAKQLARFQQPTSIDFAAHRYLHCELNRVEGNPVICMWHR